MTKILNGLKPAGLWNHFENLCAIPHPSNHEEKIREHIVAWAKGIGLETIVDEVGNVIIRKPATSGMENRKGIVLQGHIDMICNINKDKDPIIPRIDGKWVEATGTTLGADNGIGVAAIMAVLEATDLVHGQVEALFTIDEEGV
jgi:dipeptidase D